MEDYEKEIKKLFVGVAIALDETELYCPDKWKLLNRKIKKLCLSDDARELEELKAERDALQAKLDRISEIHSDNESQDQIICEIEEIIEGAE